MKSEYLKDIARLFTDSEIEIRYELESPHKPNCPGCDMKNIRIYIDHDLVPELTSETESEFRIKLDAFKKKIFKTPEMSMSTKEIAMRIRDMFPDKRTFITASVSIDKRWEIDIMHYEDYENGGGSTRHIATRYGDDLHETFVEMYKHLKGRW